MRTQKSTFFLRRSVTLKDCLEAIEKNWLSFALDSASNPDSRGDAKQMELRIRRMANCGAMRMWGRKFLSHYVRWPTAVGKEFARAVSLGILSVSILPHAARCEIRPVEF